MAYAAMHKPNVLVICPPDHYVLRNLDPIRDIANLYVGNELNELDRHAGDAEIIVYSGLTGASVPLENIWQHAPRVRWIHSLAAGVDKLLFPELIESPVPVTNARGVFKRPLAEFAVLGMLYFYKHVRRLIESQRAHHWDSFLVDWLRGKIMGIVGYGEIGRECAKLAKAMGVKIYAIRRKPERSANDPSPGSDIRLDEVEGDAAGSGCAACSRATDARNQAHDRRTGICGDEIFGDRDQCGKRAGNR